MNLFSCNNYFFFLLLPNSVPPHHPDRIKVTLDFITLRFIYYIDFFWHSFHFNHVFSGVLCLFCCLISICFAHGAGSYIFTLFDDFSGNFPLLIIAFCECVAISYVYGVKKWVFHTAKNSKLKLWISIFRIKNKNL